MRCVCDELQYFNEKHHESARDCVVMSWWWSELNMCRNGAMIPTTVAYGFLRARAAT